MADNLHPDTLDKPAGSSRASNRPVLRLTPFAKGILAGVLISLAAWALLVYVVWDFL